MSKDTKKTKKPTKESKENFGSLTQFMTKKSSSPKIKSKSPTDSPPTKILEKNETVPKKDILSQQAPEKSPISTPSPKNIESKPSQISPSSPITNEPSKIPDIIPKKSVSPIKENKPVSPTHDTVKPPPKSGIPLVKRYFTPTDQPIGDQRFLNSPGRTKQEAQKSWHIRLLKEANEIVNNMEKGMLLTVEYDAGENKAIAKFYDLRDDRIKIWIDTTDHQPYCLHDQEPDKLSENPGLTTHSGFLRMERVTKFDLKMDQERPMTKIYGRTPTDIGSSGGIKEILGGAWEANIRYHHNFIYDRQLIPGLLYRIQAGKVELIPSLSDSALETKLLEKFRGESPEIREMAKFYHPIFSSPVPDLKRVAYDIEVEETSDGGLPDPLIAKYRVISVSFADNRGKKWVYVLDREDMELGYYDDDCPKDAEIYFFKNERDVILETFRVFWEYPLVFAFNSDNFDNTYLYHRARVLKIDEIINPLISERGGGFMNTRKTDFKHAVHVDLFQFFANRSIKGYAFGGAYLKNSLDDITTSLLKKGKIEHEGTMIGKMTLGQLIHYNLNDAIITMELTQFNQNLVWQLLVILMRITKLPLQDVFRLQISAWVRSLLYYEHRRKNILIPRRDEMEDANEEGFSEAVSEGKAFQGAYVVDPIPGIHFNVSVMDFSSLYPSIIKTRNLSYETVNCIHVECKDNMLPNTPHWACTKRMGIFAYVVGFLRDIRVKWFKPLSGDKSISADQRSSAKVLQSALKVFINGAYGVFGSEAFPLFCLPVAESTTAIGRFSIQQEIQEAQKMGIKVLYGDSDSVFLLNPNAEQIEKLIVFAQKTLDLDLEHEKDYQFLALSDRKKNYVGVRKGGEEVDIKGLLAKKHNTPDFIKKKFTETVDILKKIVDKDSFEKQRNQIIQIIRNTIKYIGKPEAEGGFPLTEYAVSVVLQKRPSAYLKVIPQHIRAVQMLPESEQKKLEIGSFIDYVKTRNKEGVKPLSMATIADIDGSKYKELVESTFDQVLDALGIDYEEIKGVKKLTTFFK